MGKGAEKPKPTEQEKALADISAQQFTRYQEVLAPFEDEWLEQSRVTGGEKERLAGEIAGGVEKSFSGAGQRLKGMNPASGAFTAGARELALSKGKARAGGMAEGTLQAENADVEAMMSGIQLGRGEAVRAQSGMGEMAALSTSKAINKAFTDQAESDATADMVGSGAGVAAWGATRGMAPKVSDAELVASGGSVGARNASRFTGNGLVP